MKKRTGLKYAVMILLLLVGISACGAGIYFLFTDLTLTFTEENPEFLVGEKRRALDFVAETNGAVTAEKKRLDTSLPGEKEMVYTVKKDFRTKDFVFRYTVTENVPPKVLRTGDGVVLERGTKFDIDQVISYGDNLDPAPKLRLKGKVDMDKNGTYPLTAIVKDACGNKTKWDFTVEVADSVPYYEDTRPRTSFADFRNANAGKDRSFGIDVSVWQGDIDFQKVRAAGCEFVIIRIGYSEKGKVTEDSKFRQNFERARKAGLKVGIYLFSEDASDQEIRSSARWVLKQLDGAKLDLPIAFDWENYQNFQVYGVDFRTMNGLYDAFADEVGKGGYECMLYGSKIYLEDLWEDRDTRKIWLAHYADETDYKGRFMLWQKADTGRIDGIEGDVDLNILYSKDISGK